MGRNVTLYTGKVTQLQHRMAALKGPSTDGAGFISLYLPLADYPNFGLATSAPLHLHLHSTQATTVRGLGHSDNNIIPLIITKFISKLEKNQVWLFLRISAFPVHRGCIYIVWTVTWGVISRLAMRFPANLYT